MGVGRHLNAAFKIAGHTIWPGERVRFDLPGAQLYTHTPLDMPVEVVNGRRAGPTLLICAAIHGDEINGVEIIRRLSALKALSRLHGTLILVPVVNLFGFIHQSRYLPDRRDLNRCFPGSGGGSLGSRVAHLFFEEVVVRSTHIVDLHTGAIHRDNLPQIRATLDDPVVREMALGFSIPVIVNAGLIDKSLRSEAGKRGIPVITYEGGEALRFDESCIVAGVRGVTNVMRTLGMLPAKHIRRVRAEPYVSRSTVWVRAPIDGIFRTSVRLGARVGVGDALGSVTSPFATSESTLTSGVGGIIICVNRLPLVNEGEALIHIARFAQAARVEDEIASHGSEIEEDPLYEPGVLEDVALGPEPGR